MIQDTINLIDELRQLANQVAHTFTLNLAHGDIDDEQCARLQDALTEIHRKSKQAFLLTIPIRGAISDTQKYKPESGGLVGHNVETLDEKMGQEYIMPLKQLKKFIDSTNKKN